MARIIFPLLAIAILIQVTGRVSGSRVLACSRSMRDSATLSAQDGCPICKRPDGTDNKWAKVTDILLDKSEIKSTPRKDDNKSEAIVGVTTIAEDPEGDVLKYRYTISGGRLMGSGSNVSWNLNGQIPGTYTITAVADDGCGSCGEKMTKSVKITDGAQSR